MVVRPERNPRRSTYCLLEMFLFDPIWLVVFFERQFATMIGV